MIKKVRFVNTGEIYPYTQLQNETLAVGDIIDARQSYIDSGLPINDNQEYAGVISLIDEHDGEKFILFHPCGSEVEVVMGIRPIKARFQKEARVCPSEMICLR